MQTTHQCNASPAVVMAMMSGFPESLNEQRVTSVAQAIKAVEAATTQPEMLSFKK